MDAKVAKKVKSLLDSLDKIKAKLGADRDELREWIYEAEGICENFDEAINDIERAADIMSQLV